MCVLCGRIRFFENGPPTVFANRAAIKEHEAEVRQEYENKVRLNQLLHLRASIPEMPQPPAAH